MTQKLIFLHAITTVTGESYAGMYLSYTANLIYSKQKELALKLQGVLFIDPVLTKWVPLLGYLSRDSFESNA
jgi:hypothetical protein